MVKIYGASDDLCEIEGSKIFGKWISVMDALPPEYLTVLAYSDKHRVLVGAMDDWDWGWHITHWMPLPPPPREDNHES